MCGICGIVQENIKPSDINRMVDALVHRGPDDVGVFINSKKTFGFGHRRLSIIDLGSGQQPMCNEDGTLWITFNGEIYNYLELKEDLVKRHQFKTQSDTEVILHLFEEKGEQCLQDLRGMFAFAIYDQQTEELFIARDHLGQKPLYYYHNNDEFAFASEIKALLAVKPGLAELDPEALYEYLTIRIITPPRSMFRKIRKLAPGNYLIFNGGNLQIKRYWHLNFEPKFSGDFADALTELETRVQATVNYHLVSDVPVGAFLSGGMDSSLVVAMMSQLTDEPIQTFSGDVPYENYSEGPHAKIVSAKYKTDHHELTINPSLVRDLPELVWFLDEPSDPLSVCMYHISHLTRKHVKVVLGGDGGDELFGGYDRYYGNRLVNFYALLPESVRKHILDKLIRLTPESFWYRSLSHKVRWMHQMSFYDGGDRYTKSLSYFYFSDRFKDQLYTEKLRNSVDGFDPEGSLKAYFDCDNASDIIDKMLFVDSMTRMPDHPNMILDRMTMAHGLEARSPFLDHKLAEFCAGLPSEFKVKGAKLRHIEVELAKKYLPPKLLAKKKQGFSSALPYLLENEYKTLFRVLLKDSHLVDAGYLQNNAIQNLLAEHTAKKADHGNRLWLLCNSEIWYRMYIENTPREILTDVLNCQTVS